MFICVALAFTCGVVLLTLIRLPMIANLKRDRDHSMSRDRLTPTLEEQLGSRPSKTRIRELPIEVSEISQQNYQLYRDLHSRIRAHKGLDMDAVDALRASLDSLDMNEVLDLLRLVDSSDTEHHEYISQANFIAGSLARRDPALALDTFIPRIRHNPEGVERQLTAIYSIWLRSDEGDAKAWLNAQDKDVAPILLSKLRSLNTTKTAEQDSALKEPPPTRPHPEPE